MEDVLQEEIIKPAIEMQDQVYEAQKKINIFIFKYFAHTVFDTNKEDHKHNTKTVRALYTDIVTTDAEDYRKDPKTGGMSTKQLS